jgi:hypothetical protein
LPELPITPSSLLAAKYGHEFRRRIAGMSSADKIIFGQLVASARRKGRALKRVSFHNMLIEGINVQIHDSRYILYDVKRSELGDTIELLYLGHVLHEDGIFKFDFE